ncbi:MAG: hypothetical protein J5586_05935 [Clostridia bacterium]|nr:hypothetical protein [Clostridia bacterium]
MKHKTIKRCPADGGPADGDPAHSSPAHGDQALKGLEAILAGLTDGAVGGPADGDTADGDTAHGSPADGNAAHGDPADDPAADDPAAEAAPAVGPAERLGRAMLARLGAAEDVDEDELVDALVREWEAVPAAPEEPEEPRADAEEIFAPVRRPVPMRTGGAASSPVDYAGMSREQFRKLGKFLKRADSDGRRIRLG